MIGITTAGSSFVNTTPVGTSELVIEMTSHCTSIVKLFEIVIEEKLVRDVSNTIGDGVQRSKGFFVARVRFPLEIVRLVGAGVKV